MENRPRCPQCGSTSFHIADDGLTWCSNDHQQEGGPVIGQDFDDTSQRGRILRKKEEQRQKATRVLRGVKAFKLFLQAWQYILWKQSYALVHQKGLPPDLWNLVRELWSLRLGRLAVRLEIEEFAEQTVQRTGGVPKNTKQEDDDEDSTNLAKQKPVQRHEITSNPSLIDTIALSYLAILLLRQPLGLAQYYEWIQNEEIPYIRAIRHISTDIKERLPGTYHAALDTQTILRQDALQEAVYRMALMYNSTFAMAVPAINHVLLLGSYIKHLALPLEVFQAVQRLNTIIKIDFNFPFRTQSKISALAFPEAQLMALTIIATKLLFPFDYPEKSDTFARSANDPSVLVFDWKRWLEVREHVQSSATRNTGLQVKAPMQTTDKDIFNMTDEQLDNYMDWYQQMWIQPNTVEGVGKQILDMFPLKEVSGKLSQHDLQSTTQPNSEIVEEGSDKAEERVKRMQSSLKVRQLPDSDVTDRGNGDRAYAALRARLRRFPTAADLGPELKRSSTHNTSHAGYSRSGSFADPTMLNTTIARVFHEDAARIACLNVETLLRAVMQIEQKLVIWTRAKRRADFWDEDEINIESERRLGTLGEVAEGDSSGGESEDNPDDFHQLAPVDFDMAGSEGSDMIMKDA